ncbi:MAG: N-6 DNA methylase, partial [Bacteroidia bacterium]|nr:N-6 DNA methylase [Bacteroidia bacterium]
MNQKIIQAINDYRERLIQTSSESAKKETFKTLLIRLYDNESSLRKIIDEFDAGSEKVVYNIPLAHRNKIGFADTQYRNVIIEFERDLKVTLEHAKEQLSEYLVGNWLSGNNFDYVLIATDCLTWKVYSPKFDNLLKTDILTPEDIELVEKHSFILDAKNALDFYYFIDHYIFRTQPQIPTYETIKNDFGDLSQTFLNCLRILIGYWSKVENDPEIKIAYEQWKLFLNIAYGRFNDDVRVFLVHTYLSIFSKFLAYSVITGQRYINDSDLRDIVNGEIFKKLNVNNFIEKDFYYWVGKEPHFPKLRPLFRHLVVQISDYDFSTTNEDILKGVYQELIDIDTKHALGEYYTPDWLAAMITNHLDIDENTSVLDPSCGSGSFLRAVISKMIGSSPEPDINEITNNVVGIDIHPLSVQIAKTTVLLSFGKRLSELKRPLNLHVYLANTLKIVRESKDLLDTIFTVEINNTKIYLDRAIIQEQSLFDDIINFCQKLAELDSPALRINQNEFSEIFRGQFPRINNSNIIKSAHNIFMQLRDAVFQKKDSIWAFILIISYKP